jgi:uncharacterized protein (DUF1684 family)
VLATFVESQEFANKSGGLLSVGLNYAEEVLSWRKEKDDFLKEEGSPIPDHEKGRFLGLRYFPPDKKLKLDVKLLHYQDPVVVTMITSKGTQQRFYKSGYFQFEVNGERVRLEAFRSAEREDNHLFVPFRDDTSGKESYGAARYIDLNIREDDKYVLDFNYAYNPYCAYNDGYVCPLPPKENWLTVAIRAGEKKFHD